MPEVNSLNLIVLGLCLIFEIELLVLGIYWLLRNQKRCKELQQLDKENNITTLSFAPVPLLLASILDNTIFQIALIIVLTIAIVAVISIHVYRLWKSSINELKLSEDNPKGTSVEVHQEFALQVDKEHPLAIKIPVCAINVDKNTQADNALKVDFCDKDITNPLVITNKKGETMGKIWTILITNGRGETVGYVQPVIIENCKGETIKQIAPFKVDHSNSDEAHHSSLCITNKRDEAVVFIKPLVVVDAEGKLVGSADLPTVVNDQGEIVGIARPIVVLDENGKAVGTLPPTVNFEDGKAVQSVLFTADEGEITIPMHSITVDDVNDIDRATLPEIFVSGADNSGDTHIKNIFVDEEEEVKGRQTTLIFDPSATTGKNSKAQGDVVDKDDIEEIRTIDKEKGEVTIVRYNKSFIAKLIQLSDTAKGWYGTIKNEMLSYNRVWNRTSWSSDNINMCDNCMAKFVIVKDILCLYFATDFGKIGRKLHVVHGGKGRYKKTPWLLRIESKEDVEAAVQLFAIAAKKYDLERLETRNVNYYLTYESTTALIERGLMKEISRKTIKQTQPLKTP
jgi:hypothetical protein